MWKPSDFDSTKRYPIVDYIYPFPGGNVRSWSEGLSHVTPRLVPGADHAMAIYYEVRDEILAFVRRVMRV